MKNRIFSTDSPKAIKASGFGYLNAIHYMAPHTLGGVGNLCSHSTKGCRNLCLGRWSGAATYYDSVNKSRKTKARRFMRERPTYLTDIIKAIKHASRQADRQGLKLCVRLNGSTDIAWEGIRHDGLTLFDMFPDLQFVDYTKNPKRMTRKLPHNYHLTFSRSETNEADCVRLLEQGHNVSVVFAGKHPQMWNGFEVIDGDLHDLRHLDPRGARGVVIGLSPKGYKAKKDKSGFVLRMAA